MDDGTSRLIAGALLLGVAGISLYGSLLPHIEFPVLGYGLVVIALFGGVYLIGRSRPGRLV